MNAAKAHSILDGIKGAKILSVVYTSDVKALKTGNPYKTIRKVSKINAMINYHYEDGVKRRLAAEGKNPEDFQSGSSWHSPVIIDGKMTAFCKHNKTGAEYLRLMLNRVISTQYFADGKPVDKSEIEAFLPKKSSYSNQGLDNTMKVITLGLDNVLEITVNGKTYS